MGVDGDGVNLSAASESAASTRLSDVEFRELVCSSGLTTISALLAGLLAQKENTVRERLRDLYREADAKAGMPRRALEVTECFAPLLRWVLAWWPPEERRLAIALDASNLGTRFVVLAVCVLYRGCALPIAWVVLPANVPGAWQPHWERLLGYFHDIVPADWSVIVLADRGLYSSDLYQAIVRVGWHPFLRLKSGGTFRPVGEDRFRALRTAAPQVGRQWCGEVACFKTNPVRCTLLACWEAGYKEAWLLMTDLAPNQADAVWYRLRGWIECGFKDSKRDGWQWQQTKMQDAQRATRLWLAFAVATLWSVSVGGAADASLPARSLDELPAAHVARRRPRLPWRVRSLSVFRRGLGVILVALLRGDPLPLARFRPDPWPSSTTAPPVTFLQHNMFERAA